MLNKYKLRKKNKEIKLNLGCGFLEEKDSIGIDIRDCGQEIIWDLNKGIPFPDESVDMVCSMHFIEHLDDKEFYNLLLEIYRILKVGGTTENIQPHARDLTALYLGHKSVWFEEKVDSLVTTPEFKNFEVIMNNTIEGGNRGSQFELVFKLKKLK